MPQHEPRAQPMAERPAWAGAAGDLAPSRLGEAVIERLTTAILDGRLKPGDALPSEGQIASTFGVSKPIAREALRELAAMGVVQVQQGKVGRVRAIDSGPLSRMLRFAMAGAEEGFQEAVELRRLLEPAVARLAAQRRTAADIVEMRAILARLEQSRGDSARWLEADLAFHRHIAAMAHNGLIALQMQALEPITREMMEAFNARSRRTAADWRQTFDRHARAADAIEAGDAAAAEQALRQHFAPADAAIAEIFGSRRARR